VNVLLPSKWNKDSKDGAWRMDVDIVLEHDEQDDAEDETEEDEVAFI
jgi:hypothetical protein